jgi:hypothetical protein
MRREAVSAEAAEAVAVDQHGQPEHPRVMTRFVPPYDTIGSVSPVTGARPSATPTLTSVWNPR